MSMIKESGSTYSTLRIKTEVNQAVTTWVDFIERIYPERRSCVPVIKEIANRMLVQIDQFQLKTGKPMPEEIYNTRFIELTAYTQVCTQTKDELPKNIDKAIEELDKQMILQATQFEFKNEVANWSRRLSQASAKKFSGCAPLVQGKAREILLHLEQMKDLSSGDLLRVSERGGQYLENYAHRCLQDGAEALPLDLPKDLQAKPSQNSPPPTRRPNPDTEMSD